MSRLLQASGRRPTCHYPLSSYPAADARATRPSAQVASLAVKVIAFTKPRRERRARKSDMEVSLCLTGNGYRPRIVVMHTATGADGSSGDHREHAREGLARKLWMPVTVVVRRRAKEEDAR